MRNSTKVILVLGVSFLLTAVEGWLDGKVAVSGLLAVVSMACVLKVKCIPAVSKRSFLPQYHAEAASAPPVDRIEQNPACELWRR